MHMRFTESNQYSVFMSVSNVGYGPFDATNVTKHLINKSEERILQIGQSKNTR